MEIDFLVKGITRLAVSFGIEMSQERLKLYVEDLKGIPDTDLLPALGLHEYDYFPCLRKIHERAGQVPESCEAEAERIWDLLRRNHSQLMKLQVPGPVLAVIKAMGGRGSFNGSFGMWSSEQEPWKRKDFIRLYVAEVQGPPPSIHPQVTTQQVKAMLSQVRE